MLHNSFSHDALRILTSKINDLDIHFRSKKVLEEGGVVYGFQLVQKTEVEFLKLPMGGRKSLTDVQDFLAGFGLHFGMTLNIPRFLSAEEAVTYLKEGEEGDDLRVQREFAKASLGDLYDILKLQVDDIYLNASSEISRIIDASITEILHSTGEIHVPDAESSFKDFIKMYVSDNLADRASSKVMHAIASDNSKVLELQRAFQQNALKFLPVPLQEAAKEFFADQWNP